MDISIDVILKILLAIPSTAGFILVFVLFYFAHNKFGISLSALADSFLASKNRTWKSYRNMGFILFVFGSLMGMVYGASKTMLYWIPYWWGYHEDEDWHSNRDTLFGMIGFFGGILAFIVLDKYAQIREQLPVLQNTLSFVTKAISSNSSGREHLIKELENDQENFANNKEAIILIQDLDALVKHELKAADTEKKRAALEIEREETQKKKAIEKKERSAELLRVQEKKKREVEQRKLQKIADWRTRREHLLQVPPIINSSDVPLQLETETELSLNSSLISVQWKGMCIPFRAIVTEIADLDSINKFKNVSLNQLGCEGITATLRLRICYSGNRRDGNGAIFCVGDNEELLPIEHCLKVQMNMAGLLSAHFLIWGSKTSGAIDHGFYGVPEYFLFNDDALIETLLKFSEMSSDDFTANTVLQIPTNFRIKRDGNLVRISCLGYEANAGICDYWLEIDNSGKIERKGKKIEVAPTFKVYY
jgi:hypothetical protein